MKKEEAKDVIQSYLITTAKYSFTVTEKRIMYRIIEAGQDLLEGQKLRGSITVSKNLLDDRIVTMGFADVLPDGSRNYQHVRKALLSLLKKTVVWEQDGKGEACSLIEHPRWDNNHSIFSLRVPSMIWEVLVLQYQKGFRKYQLQTAMSFKSVYSMRLYELMSGQREVLTYSINNIKKMLSIEGKYTRLYDFQKRVLNVAKTELDLFADWSFEYVVLGDNIKFVPYPIEREDATTLKRLRRETSLYWDLEPETIKYLKNIGFTTKEINNNRELFREAEETLPDFWVTLAILKGKSRTKTNQKGWIVNAIKGKISDTKAKNIR